MLNLLLHAYIIRHTRAQSHQSLKSLLRRTLRGRGRSRRIRLGSQIEGLRRVASLREKVQRHNEAEPTAGPFEYLADPIFKSQPVTAEEKRFLRWASGRVSGVLSAPLPLLAQEDP
eukprot:1181343-Prorocentrum_minimum.AAC.1